MHQTPDCVSTRNRAGSALPGIVAESRHLPATLGLCCNAKRKSKAIANFMLGDDLRAAIEHGV